MEELVETERGRNEGRGGRLRGWFWPDISVQFNGGADQAVSGLGIYDASGLDLVIARFLGLMCFAVQQDYELALSNYRLVQSDFKKDKGWFQFAAANEMTALALYMLDGSKRDTEVALGFFHCVVC